jgi:ABC-type proline/glycine betaine transport system substrate-binding protein
MRAGTIVSLALATLLTAAPSFEAEAKTKVVIGEQTWTGATAIQYVLKVILEKYLDGDVGSICRRRAGVVGGHGSRRWQR